MNIIEKNLRIKNLLLSILFLLIIPFCVFFNKNYIKATPNNPTVSDVKSFCSINNNLSRGLATNYLYEDCYNFLTTDTFDTLIKKPNKTYLVINSILVNNKKGNDVTFKDLSPFLNVQIIEKTSRKNFTHARNFLDISNIGYYRKYLKNEVIENSYKATPETELFGIFNERQTLDIVNYLMNSNRTQQDIDKINEIFTKIKKTADLSFILKSEEERFINDLRFVDISKVTTSNFDPFNYEGFSNCIVNELDIFDYIKNMVHFYNTPKYKDLFYYLDYFTSNLSGSDSESDFYGRARFYNPYSKSFFRIPFALVSAKNDELYFFSINIKSKVVTINSNYGGNGEETPSKIITSENYTLNIDIKPNPNNTYILKQDNKEIIFSNINGLTYSLNKDDLKSFINTILENPTFKSLYLQSTVNYAYGSSNYYEYSSFLVSGFTYLGNSTVILPLFNSVVKVRNPSNISPNISINDKQFLLIKEIFVNKIEEFISNNNNLKELTGKSVTINNAFILNLQKLIYRTLNVYLDANTNNFLINISIDIKLNLDFPSEDDYEKVIITPEEGYSGYYESIKSFIFTNNLNSLNLKIENNFLNNNEYAWNIEKNKYGLSYENHNYLNGFTFSLGIKLNIKPNYQVVSYLKKIKINKVNIKNLETNEIETVDLNNKNIIEYSLVGININETFNNRFNLHNLKNEKYFILDASKFLNNILKHHLKNNNKGVEISFDSIILVDLFDYEYELILKSNEIFTIQFNYINNLLKGELFINYSNEPTEQIKLNSNEESTLYFIDVNKIYDNKINFSYTKNLDSNFAKIFKQENNEYEIPYSINIILETSNEYYDFDFNNINKNFGVNEINLYLDLVLKKTLDNYLLSEVKGDITIIINIKNTNSDDIIYTNEYIFITWYDNLEIEFDYTQITHDAPTGFFEVEEVNGENIIFIKEKILKETHKNELNKYIKRSIDLKNMFSQNDIKGNPNLKDIKTISIIINFKYLTKKSANYVEETIVKNILIDSTNTFAEEIVETILGKLFYPSGKFNFGSFKSLEVSIEIPFLNKIFKNSSSKNYNFTISYSNDKFIEALNLKYSDNISINEKRIINTYTDEKNIIYSNQNNNNNDSLNIKINRDSEIIVNEKEINLYIYVKIGDQYTNLKIDDKVFLLSLNLSLQTISIKKQEIINFYLIENNPEEELEKIEFFLVFDRKELSHINYIYNDNFFSSPANPLLIKPIKFILQFDQKAPKIQLQYEYFNKKTGKPEEYNQGDLEVHFANQIVNGTKLYINNLKIIITISDTFLNEVKIEKNNKVVLSIKGKLSAYEKEYDMTKGSNSFNIVAKDYLNSIEYQTIEFIVGEDEINLSKMINNEDKDFIEINIGNDYGMKYDLNSFDVSVNGQQIINGLKNITDGQNPAIYQTKDKYLISYLTSVDNSNEYNIFINKKILNSIYNIFEIKLFYKDYAKNEYQIEILYFYDQQKEKAIVEYYVSGNEKVFTLYDNYDGNNFFNTKLKKINSLKYNIISNLELLKDQEIFNNNNFLNIVLKKNVSFGITDIDFEPILTAIFFNELISSPSYDFIVSDIINDNSEYEVISIDDNATQIKGTIEFNITITLVTFDDKPLKIEKIIRINLLESEF